MLIQERGLDQRLRSLGRTPRKQGAVRPYRGKGVSGARPIASKANGVDRRHNGLQHVTQSPAPPWDWRWAIVGGSSFTSWPDSSTGKEVSAPIEHRDASPFSFPAAQPGANFVRGSNDGSRRAGKTKAARGRESYSTTITCEP